MDDKQRLDLSKMIKEYQSEETTDKIRELKHSKMIYNDVNTMILVKKQYTRMERENNEQFKNICKKRCEFLYNNYTNIFNKLFKDELDLNILHQFLQVLQRIENGEIDQHEGSYLVGMTLKKLYIDSALKHEKKLDAVDKKRGKDTKPSHKSKNISWNEYKKLQEE